MLSEKTVQALVAKIKATWDPKLIEELLDSFKPFLLKQQQIICDMYHVSAKEAEEELRSAFLRILFSYDVGHTWSGTDVVGFHGVSFTRWLKRKIKIAWVDCERVTKRRSDDREGIMFATSDKPPILDQIEIDDILEVNYKDKPIYSQIFYMYFVDKQRKQDIAKQLKVTPSQVVTKIREIRELFKEYLSNE